MDGKTGDRARCDGRLNSDQGRTPFQLLNSDRARELPILSKRLYFGERQSQVRSWSGPFTDLSNHSTAADQSHQEQYDRDDQQHPDEVAERVTADHSEQPQNDQNDRNSFEHAFG